MIWGNVTVTVIRTGGDFPVWSRMILVCRQISAGNDRLVLWEDSVAERIVFNQGHKVRRRRQCRAQLVEDMVAKTQDITALA